MTKRCDVAVIGAGPCGSAAAIALAQKGASVLLLEANPAAASRFAGEWIHPPGVEVLRRLGIPELTDIGGCRGTGFVVFPDDGGDPIELAYPNGSEARMAEHSDIVELLRDSARNTAGIEYRPYTRVNSIDGHRLEVTSRQESGTSRWRVHAERIVGAGGRSSIVRPLVGGPEHAVVSNMASLELVDCELPFEGMGHVILGGPGPLLIYRIDARRVRVCIDVPLSAGRRGRSKQYLWEEYLPAIPTALRGPYRAALDAGPLRWASTMFRPRSHYARGPLALVGESVGSFHPMTASGMTVGFADAEILAQCSSWRTYQRRRERETYTSELLAGALYQVFSRHDHTAASIRQAVYRMWRQSPAERARTVRVLMGGDVPRRGDFATAFIRAGAGAAARTLKPKNIGLPLGWWREVPRDLSDFTQWLPWALASFTPGPLRRSYRHASSEQTPIPPLSALLPAPPQPQTHLER